MRLILIPLILFLVSACGGGGGGGNGSNFTSNNINNVPTCSDTGTSYQTTEYNGMAAGYSNNGLRTVCASTAYANGATGSGVKIAYMDTGIRIYTDTGNIAHQEFGVVGQTDTSRVNVNPDSATNTKTDVYRWDDIPNDEQGHGTHVAGIMAADKDNVGMHGIAYESTLIPIKIFTPWSQDYSVQGRYTFAWGFYNSYQFGVDILNNSWGFPSTQIGTTCNSEASCKTWMNASYSDNYYFYSHVVKTGDIMMVWSAGNDGFDNPNVGAGGCYYFSEVRENCVIVAALGTDGKIATSDNTGGVYSSNKCGIASSICISAPGSVYSSTYNGTNTYDVMHGTSMAAPLVSGGLALIKQKHTSLTHAQVIDRLFATAVDHDIYSQESIYGHGLMDIGAATSAIGSLQAFSSPINNLDSNNASFSELRENSYFSSGAFNASINLAVKDKTMEVYDSFDRANFSIYLESFFNDGMVAQKHTVENHLNNLVLNDDHEVSKITKFGRLSFNSRDNLNRSLFTSFDERINIGTNTSANTFFNKSKKSIGVNTPLINNKLYENPYFYYGEQNLSLSFNGDYFSSELSTDNEGANFGYSINLQPTSKNYLDNDKYGDIEVSFGTMFEKNKILNSFGAGVFNTNELSSTKFARLKYNHFIDDLNLFANINFGSSEIKSNNNSYIGNSDSIITSSYALGLIKNNFLKHNNKFALVISQPQKVIDGHMKLTVPTASNSDREVTYTSYDLNLASSVTEMNYDLFYIMKLTPDNSLYLNFTHIDNPNHDASLNSYNNVSLVYKKFF